VLPVRKRPVLQPRPALVAALLLAFLGLARLLPEDGATWEYLRLAAAAGVALLPGAAIARALGQRSVAATVGWALAALAAALAVTVAVHRSLALTLGLLAVVTVVAGLRPRTDLPPRVPGTLLVAGLGVVAGIALWHVAGVIHGDAFFHLARVRKLDDFGGLSLSTVDEFRDGGLHPGYAFPLFHGFLAVLARLAGVDPEVAMLHAPSVLAPLAFLAWYEAGAAVFRSAWLGGATLLASLAIYMLAPDGGGVYSTLAIPGTAARQILVPAAIGLFFLVLRQRSWALMATLAALSLDLALVHVTYALFLALPLVVFAGVRLLLARTSGVEEPARSVALALAALLVPMGAVVAWLLPIVQDTASHAPSGFERRRALAHYATDLVVSSPASYHLRPEAFGRTGAVAVATLVLLPLAVFAGRRRWAALVLGGYVTLLALELWPWLFTRFSDAVSLSQSRRAAGFVPLTVAFAGIAAVLARRLGPVLLPVGLVAGIVLQHRFGGDFGHGLGHGGPALATWIATAGGLVALVALPFLARRQPVERTDWVPFAAAALFVLPIALHGVRNWSPTVASDGSALTPGLVEALRRDVPARAVVFADLETSYRIMGAAPVYVANAPPAHVADTKENRPCARRRELIRFLGTGELRIPQAYGARWLVLRRDQRPELQKRLPRAYRDGTFTLLRVPPADNAVLPRVSSLCTS